jgi:hypothetical protein
MQETQDLICIDHIACPRIPSRVLDAAANTCEDEDDYKSRVG